MRHFIPLTVGLLALAACAPADSIGNALQVTADAATADAATADARPSFVVQPAPSWSNLPAVVAPDAELSTLERREAQYNRLCASDRGDSFFKRLCGPVRPNIPDMATLLQFVGLDTNRAFALTGNSTSLVAMNVSALNPRILLFPRVDERLERPKDLTAIGFVRGEQFVEIVSRDNASGDLNFYLFSFEQSCSYRQGGCDLANLLTEEVEHDWTAYSVYDRSDLERTSFDCSTCHEPGGAGAPRILRMQELTSPWMHWFPQKFQQRTESDRVLTPQFLDAHRPADKQYGGVPIATIENAIDEGSGAQLEALIRAEGYGDQPNAFSSRIAAESANGASSATWLAQFDVAARGEAIPVPYPRIDVTDEAKRTAASRSYRDVTLGGASRASLVDTRDVFSQDAMEKLSFVPKPGADGLAVLKQMCSRCHDGRGNPTAPRTRFDVHKLDVMDRAEKDLAIRRMNDPQDRRMPPWRFGRMTPEAINAVTMVLSR